MARNASRRIMRNDNELYVEMLEERDVKFFRQYVTPNFIYPTAVQMKEIVTINHVWKKGDRYFKLAHKHYGNSQLWWVIAWFNKKPTESHVSNGSMILIPKPLQVVLKYLRNED